MNSVKLKLVLCIILAVVITGCDSMKFDGISVGALYLNTDINTSSSHTVWKQQFDSKQSTKIEQVIPIVLFNFTFK